MALINVMNINVLDNPTVLSNPFQFEITFEAKEALPDGGFQNPIVASLVSHDLVAALCKHVFHDDNHCTDLEWKATYVGSATDRKFDQVLEEVLVGPIPKGVHKFVLQVSFVEQHAQACTCMPRLMAGTVSLLLLHPPSCLQTAPPDPTKIPKEDLLGVTVVLISCSYANQEFIRVGYYVSNGLPGAEASADGDADADAAATAAAADAAALSPGSLERTILAESPRVTRFLINWTPQDAAAMGGVDASAAAAAQAEAGDWEDDEEGDIGLDELGDGDDEEGDDDDADEDDMDLTSAGGVQGGW